MTRRWELLGMEEACRRRSPDLPGYGTREYPAHYDEPAIGVAMCGCFLDLDHDDEPPCDVCYRCNQCSPRHELDDTCAACSVRAFFSALYDVLDDLGVAP